MTAMDRERIGAAFGAAQDYDAHARIQRIVAGRLADRIAALPLPAHPRVLEIGCGTGFLTRALRERGIGGEWLVTDIAPRMVERCAAVLGDVSGVRFAMLDGEYGKPDNGPFDLVCSSLAMQWFDDQARAVERMLGWLAPSGHCLFTTLVAGSFAQWRAAHEAEGLAAGTIDFLTREQVGAIVPHALANPATFETHMEKHGNGMEFMRSLRSIGAHSARARHRPLGPGEMRRVLRRFEQGGAAVTYEVATCHYRKAR